MLAGFRPRCAFFPFSTQSERARFVRPSYRTPRNDRAPLHMYMAARPVTAGSEPDLRLGRQPGDPRPPSRCTSSRSGARPLTAQASLLSGSLPPPAPPRMVHKPRTLPTIPCSQPNIARRVRPRTAINAPPRWSPQNVSIQHGREPIVRLAFVKRPMTAPAAPRLSPATFSTALGEQKKWASSSRSDGSFGNLVQSPPLREDVELSVALRVSDQAEVIVAVHFAAGGPNELVVADAEVTERKNEKSSKSKLDEARELKAAGYQAKHLHKRGFDVGTLQQAGFSAKVLKEQGFQAGELRSAGFTLADLRWLYCRSGGIGQLMSAGYSTTELREVRCPARTTQRTELHATPCPCVVVRRASQLTYSRRRGSRRSSCTRAAST